jgi:hypothetical protein
MANNIEELIKKGYEEPDERIEEHFRGSTKNTVMTHGLFTNMRAF